MQDPQTVTLTKEEFIHIASHLNYCTCDWCKTLGAKIAGDINYMGEKVEDIYVAERRFPNVRRPY